jgi:hypothetical protein
MMAARQTLLNLVAQKYTNRREDVAVDALGYILGYSDAAREAITDKLRDANIGVAAISKVITQATGVDGERPDLACYDDQDNECLLIEAKFWARLTDNQPGGYLNRLHGDPPSTLLFVAPAARLGSLWSDLQQRLSDQGNCSDLRGSSAFPIGCGRVAKHGICFASRPRPLKREQLRTRVSSSTNPDATSIG